MMRTRPPFNYSSVGLRSVPLVVVTGHVVTQPITLMMVAAGEWSKMCRYVTLAHPWLIELQTFAKIEVF